MYWALMLLGMYVGRSRMTRLHKWFGELPEDPPHVTILVPAKDEGEGIARCIDAVLALEYPRFDVIAINDRSTDDTGGVLDAMAARDPRLKVVHIPAGGLPEGWLGKCHALHMGSRHAKGDWLFFVDSDVTLEPHSLRQALAICLKRDYQAVSVLTRLECHTFLERLMLPLLGAAWATMYVVSLTNDDGRETAAAANGQFFLIRRDAYLAVEGHQAVKDQITEDVELMRALKAKEFRVRLYLGQHLAATRMHSNLRQMFNGWARIYSGTPRRRPWRILMAMWFTLIGVFTVYPALIYAMWSRDPEWMGMSLLHMGLMTLYLGLVYFWSGNRPRYALLAPVAAVLMLGIFGYSLRKCQTGRIVWRDTHFAAR